MENVLMPLISSLKSLVPEGDEVIKKYLFIFQKNLIVS